MLTARNFKPATQGRSDLITLAILYFLAYFMILLNHGRYWDDWILFKQTDNSILEQFRQTGVIGIGFLHAFLINKVNSIYIYKVLTFTFLFFNGIIFYTLTGKIRQLKSLNPLLLTSLYILAPFDFTRITLITLPYHIGLFLFLLATLLVFSNFKHGAFQFLYNAIAVFFYFLSFHIQSFAVLYLAVILLLYFQEHQKMQMKALVGFLFKNAHLTITPVLFSVYRILYLTPSGLYANYNAIGYRDVFHLPQNILEAIYYNNFETLSLCLERSLHHFGIFSLILVFVWPLADRMKIEKDRCFARYIAWGFALMIISIIPYALVSKVPTPYGFDSRHQLLLPFGFSLMAYGSVIWMNEKLHTQASSTIVISIIISAMIVTHVSTYFDFQKDWYKQKAMVYAIRSNPAFLAGKTFLFDDQTQNDIDTERDYFFYEFSGLMKSAFSEENRFGILEKHYTNKEIFRDYISHTTYNMADYKLSDPDYRIEIKWNKYQLSDRNTFELLVDQLFDKEQWSNTINTIIRMDAFPYR